MLGEIVAGVVLGLPVFGAVQFSDEIRELEDRRGPFVFGLDTTRSTFVVLCITITALPVSIRILMDIGKVQAEIGQKIISGEIGCVFTLESGIAEVSTQGVNLLLEMIGVDVIRGDEDINHHPQFHSCGHSSGLLMVYH